MFNWFRRDEDDLDEEIKSHLAIEARESGVDGARRAFGNISKIKEDVRETWGWQSVRRFFDDARFGARMLRKTPGWTLTVCATLSLGIGLSTSIFSVVHAVLLRPLPYANPDRLVALWPTDTPGGGERFNVSAALWAEWRKRSATMADISLTRPVANFNLTGEGTPERLNGARISYNLLSVLGMQPLLGRMFTEEEQRRPASVALLSHGLWTRRFGGEANIIGRKIRLNGEVFEVIGVMPADFNYPTAVFEIWTPLYLPASEFRHGFNSQYYSVGRLANNATIAQAQAEFASIMQRLSEDFPDGYREGNSWIGALVEPLADGDTFTVRNMLWLLLGAAACLLLIGCMNLAVLLLARSGARAREMSVRAALGASTARLRSQLLAEVIPIAFAGAAGGLFVAWAMLRILVPMLPASIPRTASVGLHGPVVLFAIAASLAVVLLAGTLPGRSAANVDRMHSRTVTAGTRTRSVVLVAQIGVTVVLLFGATLFTRSFSALLDVHPGFSTKGVLTMHLAVTRAKYPSDPRVAEYYRQITSAVGSIPGVSAAGIVNRLPLAGGSQAGAVEFQDRPDKIYSDWRSASTGYFEAIGIPLQRGRTFSDADTPQSPRVGVIDERIAREVFGTENPIGKRFRRYLPGFVKQDEWSEIVGVVGHVMQDSLERDPRPQAYWPAAHNTQDRGALAVRVAGDPASYAKAVVDKIHEIDRDQPVYDVRSTTEWVAGAVQSRKLMTGLIGLFTVSSLLLACIGVYGVVSYSATVREREFGIRLALGARVASVVGLVLSQASRLAITGCIVGLALVFPTRRAIESMLYGVTTSDAISWLLAPLLLIVIALIAAAIPARRAAKCDPAITLRAE